jgi:hypothetical protein
LGTFSVVLVFFRLQKLTFSQPFSERKTPGLFGPLTEAQVQVLLPDHEGGGTTFQCSPNVLKELGMPSGFVPFQPYFRSHSAPFACNTCGSIVACSTERDLVAHLATLQHVTKTEEALAPSSFKPALDYGRTAPP